MPFTKEELAQLRTAIAEDVGELKTAHKKEADELRGKLKESEDARSAAEAQTRRPALYGPDGQSVISSVPESKD